LGSNPDALAYLQQVLDGATAREKALEDQQVAYKAEEPAAVEAAPDIPDLVINGITYKAFPPKIEAAAEEEAVVEEDAIGDAPVVEEVVDEGGLSLSPEDLAAIGETVASAIQAGLAQVMGAMDLEKKVAGHIQGMMAPFQATKESEQAARDEQIAALQATLKTAVEQQAATKAQLDELLGVQPAVTPRASESAQTVINPWIPSDNQLLESIKAQVPADQQFAFGDLVQNLFGTQST
jgi:hypothetical protein